MSSLVIGATGIVGGYIVEQLVREGERPIALSRQPRSDERVEWYRGDLASPEQLSLPSAQIVYCTAEIGLLAAALPFFYTPDLNRVVAFTSTSIVTKISSAIEGERVLLERLARGERQLIAECEKLGVRWTILRPTMIYAEGRDGNVTRLARIIQKIGFLPLMGKGEGLRQPVHAEDLASGAIAAASTAKSANGVYALPGSETLTYREMAGRIFDGLGKKRRIVSFPTIVWRLAFFALRRFFPGANVAMGERMSKNMVFDLGPARADFGWKPRKFNPRF